MCRRPITRLLLALLLCALLLPAVHAEEPISRDYENVRELFLERMVERREQEEEERAARKVQQEARNIDVVVTVSEYVKESSGTIGDNITYTYYVDGRGLGSEGHTVNIHEWDAIMLTAIIKELDSYPDVGRVEQRRIISNQDMDRLEAGESIEHKFPVRVEEDRGLYKGSYKTYQVTFTIAPKPPEPPPTEAPTEAPSEPPEDPSDSTSDGAFWLLEKFLAGGMTFLLFYGFHSLRKKLREKEWNRETFMNVAKTFLAHIWVVLVYLGCIVIASVLFTVLDNFLPSLMKRGFFIPGAACWIAYGVACSVADSSEYIENEYTIPLIISNILCCAFFIYVIVVVAGTGKGRISEYAMLISTEAVLIYTLVASIKDRAKTK